MFKYKYYFAEYLIKFLMLFTSKFSLKYYEYEGLLHEIYDELYYETICKQMNQNWN